MPALHMIPPTSMVNIAKMRSVLRTMAMFPYPVEVTVYSAQYSDRRYCCHTVAVSRSVPTSLAVQLLSRPWMRAMRKNAHAEKWQYETVTRRA